MATRSWVPSLLGGRRDVDPFVDLRRQMDDLVGDFMKGMKGTGLASFEGGFTPVLDVSETDKELTIKAELPGVSEKDVEVTLVANQLTIKGEKKDEHEETKEEEGRTYHRVERSYGAFQRTMTLPFDVDPASVAASFKDGVLTVSLPKPAEVQKQARKIEVKKA